MGFHPPPAHQQILLLLLLPGFSVAVPARPLSDQCSSDCNLASVFSGLSKGEGSRELHLLNSWFQISFYFQVLL